MERSWVQKIPGAIKYLTYHYIPHGPHPVTPPHPISLHHPTPPLYTTNFAPLPSSFSNAQYHERCSQAAWCQARNGWQEGRVRGTTIRTQRWLGGAVQRCVRKPTKPTGSTASCTSEAGAAQHARGRDAGGARVGLWQQYGSLAAYGSAIHH
jgi:hypothetical protein